MDMKFLKLLALTGLIGALGACASDRQTASYSRAGRQYEEPRAMNHRSLDSNTLYRACLRERPETSCRNRLGR